MKTDPITRRRAIACMALAAGATTGARGAVPAGAKKRVNQSVVDWCFRNHGEKWDTEKLCTVAKSLGVSSIELGPLDSWPTLKKHGLTCAIAVNGMPGAPFVKGLNNTAYHAEVTGRTKEAIDAAADFGCPNVIAFTGFKYRDAEDPNSGEISLEEGAKNCVAGLKELALYGEKKGVTVCLEHLNTRDSSDPNKGHPGYQGDDIDYCADIIREVGSPRAKLLFDIYHVQIMNGDLIRRIRDYSDLIGHVHTAGTPGRGELDGPQEIYYPAVIRALADTGYTGFLGQEFIPTRAPEEGLAVAVKLCDV